MTLSRQASAVYGPVRSWRFGQSLGIDLIGAVSTCSYNCLYCQLGAIEKITRDRALFVSTTQLAAELAVQDWATVEVVTFSGSGEPTLALNLGEAIATVKRFTGCPVVVLTNGTWLGDRAVQQDLMPVDVVAVKLDAVASAPWQFINRPAPDLYLDRVLQGIIDFRQVFPGRLVIQTMVMETWPLAEEQRYVAVVQALQPDEVQLNTPLRPRPIGHQLEARGNHDTQPDKTWRVPRHVTPDTLKAMVDRLQANLSMPIQYRQ